MSSPFSDKKPCNDTGAVQLLPFSSNSNDNVGRLLVCYDGHWGSVCHDFADRMTAEVACKQLGLRKG